MKRFIQHRGSKSLDSGVDISRRRLLTGTASGLGLIVLSGLSGCARADTSGRSPSNADTPTATGPVTIAFYNDAGEFQGLKQVPRVIKTPAEWKKILSPHVYQIARESGTERPFTGAYYQLPKQHGLYRCVCCHTALYDSATQFHSGTGWPSFYQPINPHNVTEHADHSFGMTRTEIACTRCAAHLGHVFHDGPPPTGLRYCMDSASLTFHPIT